MPYVDKGDKVCKADINLEAKKGDIIITYPALLKVNKNLLVYPPLSKISSECNQEIESPAWVEGYKVSGNEKIVSFTSNETKIIKGEIEVLCNKILTAFTLKKILGEIEISVNVGKVIGYPIISISNIPLVSINKDSVIVYTSLNMPILRTFIYSIFYYTTSSSEELG